MSSHIHVTDFQKQIPGELSENTWKFPILTTQLPKTGKTRSWQITVRIASKRGNEYVFHPITAEHFDSSKQLPDGQFGYIKVWTKQEDSPKFDENVPTEIHSGKNIGKANQTNAFTQALRDALGKYNTRKKQTTHGNTGVKIEIVDDVPAVNAVAANNATANNATANNTTAKEIPRYKPMLVQLLRDNPLTETDYTKGIYVQPKYNGVRCIFVREGDKVISYSRGLVDYHGFADVKEKMREFIGLVRVALLHVLEHVAEFKDKIADIRDAVDKLDYTKFNVYIDGEIYEHGVSLQFISGKARKEVEGERTIGLPFYNYDMFVPDLPIIYEYRKQILDRAHSLANEQIHALIKPVPTEKVANYAEIDAKFRAYLAAGYEGAIVRKAWLPYQYGVNNYHSKYILKLKPTLDGEYKIVGYTGEGKGKQKDALMFILETPGVEDPATGELDETKKRQFPINLGVELPERKRLFAEMSHVDPETGKTIFERDYKGRYLTILFDELSDDGVPLRARTDGVVLRDYE